MDILFGAVTEEARAADINKGKYSMRFDNWGSTFDTFLTTALGEVHDHDDKSSDAKV